jgi:SAM-dependent methyltransferase
LLPPDVEFAETPGAPQREGSVLQIVFGPAAAHSRCLHLIDIGDRAESICRQDEGCAELTITHSDRTFRLTLPPPGAAAGQIAIETDGKQIVPPRPLPAGVLPHGPQGMQLIERWDRAYRDGRKPGWDTGLVAEDLRKVVEEGVVRPCRTAVLGCGSGTNALYLAEKGFDVTAIDVAPTALSIAQTKAKDAGVDVQWLLADVLALPDLEPFDFIFDRGCYHNVRYADAAGFVESLRQMSHENTRVLILSLNRDSAPGVREHHMREDFSALYEFEWLRESGIVTRGSQTGRPSWSLMLRRRSQELAAEETNKESAK